MKKLLLFNLLLLCLACSKKVIPTSTLSTKEEVTINESEAQEPAPKMTFEKRLINLGKIKKGEQRELVYEFTNTGNADLKISQISVCDCTTILERPYLPVKPGEKGIIKAVFDSNKKEESDIIDIDIWLDNIDPVLEMPALERIQYQYEFY